MVALRVCDILEIGIYANDVPCTSGMFSICQQYYIDVTGNVSEGVRVPNHNPYHHDLKTSLDCL